MMKVLFRNKSILAHGLNPAIEKDTIDFLEDLEKYAKKTSILIYDDEGYDAFLEEIGELREDKDLEEFDDKLEIFDGSEAFDKYYEYSKFPKFEDIEL